MEARWTRRRIAAAAGALRGGVVRWVRGAAVAVCLGAVARAAEPPGVDIDWDLLSASDVQLVQGAAAGMVEVGPTSIRAGLSGGWMGFDYRPVEADLFGSARRVEHGRVGGQVSVSRVLGAGWTALADLGGYSGFLNHRSAWVAEWYQQFFAGLPGLEEPDPRGINGSAGLRWSYLRGTGTIQAEAGYSRDRIAPGFGEVFDGNGGLVDVEPLKDRISTPSVRLAFENVLTPRIRSRLTLRMVDPSERDPRYSATVEVHAAPGDRWVVRTEAGLAHETFRPPGEGSFQAWWVGATVEFAVAERWHLWMRGRHYRDNGEIENTLSFSTAAPALETYEMLAGVRWQRGAHAFLAGAGPYVTRFDPVTFNTLFFAHLYRDRTYLAAQVSYRWQF